MAAMGNLERLDTNQRMSQTRQVAADDSADVAGQTQQT
jgi:hypothetical protein